MVEDHEDLRDAIVESLEHAGWAVRAYDRAEDALLSVRRELPDVVLTDFNAGPLSELRFDPSTRGVPIVGMSGTLIPTTGMLRFFDLFLPKPIALAELDALLRRAIGGGG